MANYYYERLSDESASHLLNERSRNFSHTLSIFVFQTGPLAKPDGGVDVDRVTQGIANRLHLAPRYRQRLKWNGLDNHPAWIDDAEFNLDYHLRHTALPFPGDRNKLHKLTARLMSSSLHRSRPMWECWVAEGLEDGLFALIGKVHSCMIESDSGSDLFQSILSGDPEERTNDAPPFTPRTAPSGLELARDEFVDRVRGPGRMFDRLRNSQRSASEIGTDAARQLGAAARLFGYSVVPPRATPINGRVGPHRRFATAVVPFERVRAIHRSFDCSVHDVVLGLVCRALRNYLQARLVHPASLDLRVSTPVQVPAETGVDELREWTIELPVWHEDPAKMLATIRERTRDAYDSDPAVDATSLFSMARWSGSRTLALAARALNGSEAANLSVVNVPGAPNALYFMGAKLVEAYGATPLRGEQGLSITATSYDGKLCIGINADFDLVSEPDEISDGIVDALDEFGRLGRTRGRTLSAVPGP